MTSTGGARPYSDSERVRRCAAFEVAVKCMRWFAAAACVLPLSTTAAQQQQSHGKPSGGVLVLAKDKPFVGNPSRPAR
jgi:hypothetical protein